MNHISPGRDFQERGGTRGEALRLHDVLDALSFSLSRSDGKTEVGQEENEKDDE